METPAAPEVVKLSQLLTRAQGQGGQVTLDVPAEWMQGRSVFGGLQVALALAAMRQLVPDAILRTVQATFVAPVPAGRCQVRAHILRSGKSATHVEARIGDPDTQAIIVAVFGAPRPSVARVLPVQPAVNGRPDKPPRRVPGPGFSTHFAARWLVGTPPFTANPETKHVVSLGMIDDGDATEAHVVALADFVPPVALSHLSTPAPGSTLTWMIELLLDEVRGLPLQGWRVDAEVLAARDGYTCQTVMLWGPGGVPVALSHQHMLVFG